MMKRLLDRLLLRMTALQGDSMTSFAERNSNARKRKFLILVLGFLSVFLLLILYFYSSLPINPFSSSSSNGAPNTEGLNYAVVVDAGSSGSRAYLYAWPNHSGDKHELLNISPITGKGGEPLCETVVPGLSSLRERPKEALAYISPLLRFAQAHIPPEKLKSTPLYILATAGMRLLSKTQQEAILTHLRQGVQDNFPFLFPEGNLEIISGKQEGIYQWLAINYVLGKFRHQHNENMVALDADADGDGDRADRSNGNLVLRPRTVGAIDMGGASMQIAMEITSALQMEGMTDQEKSQVAEINIGCKDHDTEHTYRVFVTTFLGFGANEALARHNRDMLLKQMVEEKSSLSGLSKSDSVQDPCFPTGLEHNSSFSLARNLYQVPDEYRKQFDSAGGDNTVHLTGTGDWKACYDLIKNFTKTGERLSAAGGCGGGGQKGAPGAAGGNAGATDCLAERIRIPAIQFDSSEFYAFSEFWYSMEDVLRMGGPYMFTKFQKAAKDFCRTPWPTTYGKFRDGQYPKSDLHRLQTQCFKSVWVTVALHEGFGFPKTYSHLTAAPSSVNGHVVHWTIGALLYRTRFIPLRAIESRSQDQYHHGPYHSPWASGYLYTNYVILFCLVLVVAAIFIYLHRLQRFVKPSTLRKVPSMTGWLTSSASASNLRRSYGLDDGDDGEPLLEVSVGGHEGHHHHNFSASASSSTLASSSQGLGHQRSSSFPSPSNTFAGIFIQK